jgi:hypothetical protein
MSLSSGKCKRRGWSNVGDEVVCIYDADYITVTDKNSHITVSDP